MGYLYGGEILRIDLTNGKVTKESTALYAREFIGGRGINTKVIYDEVGPETKALDPESVIAFGTGPLAGTMFPGSSRTDIVAKSPVTNLLGGGNMGSQWAAELKYAGYDNIFIKGTSEKPVYILIDNEEVKIKDAAHLWGKDTYETQSMIREDLRDPEIQVICVGPAGENLVVYATVQTSVGDNCARSGMGAVLGSKKVKAIAVRGTKGVKIADPDRYFELCKELLNAIKDSGIWELRNGTSLDEFIFARIGAVGLGGFHTSEWDLEGKTNFWEYREKYGYRMVGCMGCPIACHDNFIVPGIGAGVVKCQMFPDMSWDVRNDDLSLWWEATILCQRSGLDTSATAIVLSWLMKLYEERIITAKDTDGIAMEWGKREAIIGMLRKIINREGIGDVLANGLQASVEKLGADSIEHICHVKNFPQMGLAQTSQLALASVIGRRSDPMQNRPGIGTATAYRSADPEISGISDEDRKGIADNILAHSERLTGGKEAADPWSYEGASLIVVATGDRVAITDMLGGCKYHSHWSTRGPLSPEVQAKALSLGLGESISVPDLSDAAKRLRNLERAYDVREGITRKDDTLPNREFNNPIRYGIYKDKILDRDGFEKMKDDYYAIRGWDVKTGIPTRGTLEKYGLKEVADDLEKRGKLPSTKSKAEEPSKTPVEAAVE